MSVVVGYVSTPEGDAALDVAVSEARARGLRLVVILSERGHRLGTEAAELQAEGDEVRRRLDGTGLRYDVRLTSRGHDVAEDIIGAASSEGRADRDRAAAPQPGRQAPAWVERPADPARRPVPRPRGQARADLSEAHSPAEGRAGAGLVVPQDVRTGEREPVDVTKMVQPTDLLPEPGAAERFLVSSHSSRPASPREIQHRAPEAVVQPGPADGTVDASSDTPLRIAAAAARRSVATTEQVAAEPAANGSGGRGTRSRTKKASQDAGDLPVTDAPADGPVPEQAEASLSTTTTGTKAKQPSARKSAKEAKAAKAAATPTAVIDDEDEADDVEPEDVKPEELKEVEVVDIVVDDVVVEEDSTGGVVAEVVEAPEEDAEAEVVAPVEEEAEDTGFTYSDADDDDAPGRV